MTRSMSIIFLFHIVFLLLFIRFLGFLLLFFPDCNLIQAITCARILEFGIASVEVVIIASVRCRDRIHILKPADIVRTEKAILKSDRIAFHTGAVVTPHQAVHIEFREVFVLLVSDQHILNDGLLEPRQPRHKRVLDEIYSHMLNIVESAPFQVLHHVGRHTKNTADFFHAELSGGQKLTVFRRQTNRFVCHVE